MIKWGFPVELFEIEMTQTSGSGGLGALSDHYIVQWGFTMQLFEMTQTDVSLSGGSPE